VATLCVTTALAATAPIDDIPPTIDAALPHRQRSPRTATPVTSHRFDEDTFSIERDLIPVFDELTIGIYSPARSIVDAFRLRHLYGEEEAVAGLRRWLAKPGNRPAELVAVVHHFRRRSRRSCACCRCCCDRPPDESDGCGAGMPRRKVASVAGRPTSEFVQLYALEGLPRSARQLAAHRALRAQGWRAPGGLRRLSADARRRLCRAPCGH
jgi:hypothetical protein